MENIKKLLLVAALILIVSWILFNPYIYHSDSEFISNFSFLINDFCKNINLNYRFSGDDILNLFRFLEYFVFGICSAVLYKTYSKKVWINITNPLFLGLIVSILEIYFRNFGAYKLEVRDILISFLEFCVGAFVILVFCVSKNKKAFSSKYKKNKYIGRC
ncbi:MAG: hypothetical protein IKE41_04590 [Clostridia bacterium]|nr:hypothetical protein [Clostridia bacterium]MBR2734756.1 hypothetical protein [Clostridia bacterium]